MVNKKQDGNYSFRQRRNNSSHNIQSFTFNNNPNKEIKNESKKITKSKAPPLSKYRRKTANARERTRMREINLAFENLRKCVPQSYNNYNSSSASSSADDQQQSNEKLTKITTLRLAMMYIRTLSDALTNNECHTINLDQNKFNNIKDTKFDINCDIKNGKKELSELNSTSSSSSNSSSIVNETKKIKKNKIMNRNRNRKYRKMNAFEEHNYSDFTSYNILESDGESLSFSEEKSLDLILPDLNDKNLNDITEEDFSTPFLASVDLDCMIHPFTDLFSDLTAEPTLDYLI
ncbi:achaete-scute complex protein T3 [Condylostylus longicornis]|uniref:achaete-scute complex protein T3 n=1 Tax=Condylostylus longicornis TaxID=2530218 RepID=UPI00244DCF96|nr:achaete-scute complex protein T3 [Condylostylus longicornis]